MARNVSSTYPNAIDGIFSAMFSINSKSKVRGRRLSKRSIKWIQVIIIFIRRASMKQEIFSIRTSNNIKLGYLVYLPKILIIPLNSSWNINNFNIEIIKFDLRILNNNIRYLVYSAGQSYKDN